MNAVYPNGYFTWTDRIDEVDIDYAEDINAVADDLSAVENTLGLLPQVQTVRPGVTCSAKIRRHPAAAWPSTS